MAFRMATTRIIGRSRPVATRMLNRVARLGNAFQIVRLPAIIYGPECLVRRVQNDGRISLVKRSVFISNAFAGKPIGLKPTECDGVFDILFCAFEVATLDVAADTDQDT
jgi:hypothetical protein